MHRADARKLINHIVQPVCSGREARQSADFRLAAASLKIFQFETHPFASLDV